MRIPKRCVDATLALTVAGVTALAGCANVEHQPKPARDAAIGAAAGAAVGAAVHGSNRTHGALAGAALGGLGTYIWSSQMSKQKRDMEVATQGTGVQVTQTPDNQLKLEVPSDVSFDVGSAQIKPGFVPVLDRFARTLVDNPKSTVRIVGHTDSTGTDAMNNPLSVNRAASVRNYLGAHGVAPTRVAIDGRGSSEPIASNSTEDGRSRNRRVDIFVGESAGG